jgi:acid phosphatase (class A)
MNALRAWAPALALLIAAAPGAARAEKPFYYLNPTALDLTVLLPPPPDASSAQGRADEQQVAATVAARSRTQMFQAQEEATRTVFFYTPSVGPNFTPERLPVTAAFFERVGSDVKQLIGLAKSYWERPRPDGGKKRSYPSGHAAFAAASAILLGELIPAKRDAVFGQARTFAENRIILGLHYPSDIASGWTAGTLAVYAMSHDAAFRRDFAAAKSELRRAGF